MPEYTWEGDYEGPTPGAGQYVIMADQAVMEPGEIIERLQALDDLKEQLARREERVNAAGQKILRDLQAPTGGSEDGQND